MLVCSMPWSRRQSCSKTAIMWAQSKAIKPKCWQCWTIGSQSGSFPPSLEAAAPLPVSETEIAPPRRKRQVKGQRPELLPRRAADARTVEKSRGRLEIREVWVVAADELEAYLAEEWGWQGVRQLGWIRRLS